MLHNHTHVRGVHHVTSTAQVPRSPSGHGMTPRCPSGCEQCYVEVFEEEANEASTADDVGSDLFRTAVWLNSLMSAPPAEGHGGFV